MTAIDTPTTREAPAEPTAAKARHRAESPEDRPPAASGTPIYRQYRGLLSPQRVRELSELRPARAVRDIAWMWVGILAAWGLVAWHPAWWTVLIALPVIGTRYYGLFIIGHDGLHRRIMPTVRSNDFINDVFIGGPIGVIARINRHNHMEHHKHLATEHDPDRHKHACFNKADRPAYLAFLSGLANLVPVLRNVFLPSAGSHASDARSAAESGSAVESGKGSGRGPGGERGYTMRDVAILLGWQMALIGGLTLAVGWWAYPVLWLLPVFLFAYLGDLSRSFMEHSQPEADDRADEHRMITYDAPWIERVFFAPMNMNYHTAHHLWPSIPYYNLPTADREIRDQPGAAGLEWRRSYIGYLLRYWLVLPLHECRKGRPA